MVSVCMITYGHEAFIAKAIEGVLMQVVDFDIELVIVDDASPDNTHQIVKEIIDNHPNGNWIRYIKQEKNIGMVKNFSFALKECKGEYIAICEGDDYWINNKKLKIQKEFLEKEPEFSLCFGNCNVIDVEGNNLDNFKVKEIDKSDYSKSDLIKCPLIPTLTVMFRGDLSNISFPSKLLNCDSYLFAYLAKFGTGKFLNVNFGTYRIHPNGVWSPLTKYKKMTSSLYTIRKIKEIDFSTDLKKIAHLSHIKYLIFFSKELQKDRIYHRWMFFVFLSYYYRILKKIWIQKKN